MSANLRRCNEEIFSYLIYAGTIPFILCAVCLGVDIQELALLGSVERILSVYGLVISSFLAGAHWGQSLHINENQWIFLLPIISNVTAVLLWTSFLVLSFKILVGGILIPTFIFFLIIDHRLFRLNLITRHYFRTRFSVSVIVIISLIVSGIVS